MEERLLTIPQVAAILNVTTARVYEMTRSGLLPVVRLGRQVRVDQEQLRDWIDQGGRPLATTQEHHAPGNASAFGVTVLGADAKEVPE